MFAASFPESSCLLLWEQGREPQSSAGMGNCWGKGIGDNLGESKGRSWGAAGLQRGVLRVQAHRQGLVRPGNTMVKMLYCSMNAPWPVDWETQELLDAAVVIYIKVS